MSRRSMWVMTALVFGAGVGAVTLGTRAQEPAKPEKMTAAEVVELWNPRLESATDYQQWSASPKRSPDIAACSFRVVGPTFEEMWNHYARLCGMEDRYAEKTFLNKSDDGPRGSYVVLDRWAADGKGGRSLSVFLLKTAGYTVTITFAPDPGGKSISGSLSAVVP